MCLIVFAYRCHPRYSLILLANRDEFYQRPTRAMQFWPEHPDILAGQDLEQKGTWLGINRNGCFAAVTNFREGVARSQSGLSRGHLPGGFLTGQLNAADYLQQLEPQQNQYPGYNLILGDEHGLFYSSNRGHTRQLTPGCYGLSNALLDSNWPKLVNSRTALLSAIADGDLAEEQLFSLMLNRQQPEDFLLPDTGVGLEWERRLAPCFIRSPDYGTRATSLILQQPDGQTRVVEMSHSPNGNQTIQRFELQVPAVGANKDRK